MLQIKKEIQLLCTSLVIVPVADYRGETKSEDWEQEHIPISQAISPQLEPFGSLAWDRKAGNHGTDLGSKGLELLWNKSEKEKISQGQYLSLNLKSLENAKL